MSRELLEIELLIPEHTRRDSDSFNFRLPIFSPAEAEAKGWQSITNPIHTVTEKHILASIESALYPHAGVWIRVDENRVEAARPRESIKTAKGTENA